MKIQTCHTTFWGVEAHFHLHGTVNKNFLYSSAANPHERHQRPLYDWKVTAWCAVWSRGVTGPYFFEDEDRQAITVISQHYTEMINEFLALKFPLNYNLWFQQNSAMAHRAVVGVTVLRCLFLQRVISRFGDVPWPPSLPYLTAPGFFLWGCLKSKVYSRHPVDLNALKHAIWDAIVNISEETLPDAQLLNLCAPVHSGGWWPSKDIVHKEWNNIKQI
jgi:hypothetical protein